MNSAFIDWLPSGRFRGRLMINGQRYTATLPTEADARLWELETRAAAALRRRAMLATFGAYTAGWLAGFIDDDDTRECLHLIREDATDELRTGTLAVRALVGTSRSRR